MAYDNQNEVKDEVVPNIAPFDPTKKKKVVIQDIIDDFGAPSYPDDSGAPSYPWEGNTYEELLDRVFNILHDRENNSELAGDRRMLVLRPPQVLREGTYKTVFVNFIDECKMMHRELDHVMNFLLTELGTSGSLDGQQRLVIKGRFQQKQIENVLKRYISMPFHSYLVIQY